MSAKKKTRKKGYKNRLPTVLPPAPRPAPEQDAAWTASHWPVPAATTPEPPAVPPMRILEPRPRARPRPATARGGVPPLILVEASRTPPSRKVSVGLVLALLILAIDIGLVAALVLGVFDDKAGPGPAATDDSGGQGRLVSDTSYVVSRVLPNGDVVVRQRIHTAELVQLVRLEVPQVPGVEVSAEQIDVEADGEPVEGPVSITDELGTYTFAPATELRIGYRITGAVELSGSVPGRALAVLTTLDVRYGEHVERETRVVRATDVLALACSPSVEEAPVPCGEAAGDGRWRVELTGRRVADRVVAQVNLG